MSKVLTKDWDILRDVDENLIRLAGRFQQELLEYSPGQTDQQKKKTGEQRKAIVQEIQSFLDQRIPHAIHEPHPRNWLKLKEALWGSDLFKSGQKDSWARKCIDRWLYSHKINLSEEGKLQGINAILLAARDETCNTIIYLAGSWYQKRTDHEDGWYGSVHEVLKWIIYRLLEHEFIYSQRKKDVLKKSVSYDPTNAYPAKEKKTDENAVDLQHAEAGLKRMIYEFTTTNNAKTARHLGKVGKHLVTMPLEADSLGVRLLPVMLTALIDHLCDITIKLSLRKACAEALKRIGSSLKKHQPHELEPDGTFRNECLETILDALATILPDGRGREQDQLAAICVTAIAAIQNTKSKNARTEPK